MDSPDAITIRKATLHDIDAVLECLRAAFAPYEHYYTKTALQDTILTPESYPRRLDEMTVFLALDESGRAVGTIACCVTGEGEGHLRGMAVLPECQATGVADELLKYAESELAGQRCSRVTLDTTEPLDRAMRFYERRGYRRSGKIGDFFGMPLIEYVKELRANS